MRPVRTARLASATSSRELSSHIQPQAVSKVRRLLPGVLPSVPIHPLCVLGYIEMRSDTMQIGRPVYPSDDS